MTRFFKHYLSTRLLLLVAIETLLLFGCVMLAFRLRFPDGDVALPIGEAAVFVVVVMAAMSATGLYETAAGPARATLYRLLVAFALALPAVSFVFYLVPQTYLGRGVIAMSAAFAFLAELLVRVTFFRITEAGLPQRRVLVLGDGPEARELVGYLRRANHASSARYAGQLADVGARDGDEPCPRALRETLMRMVRDQRVSEVVLTVAERRGGVLPLRQLLDCRLRGVAVLDAQSFYEREQGLLRLDTLRPSWMIFGDGFDQGRLRDAVKRFFDIVVSSAIILVSLPVLLVAAAAILLESGRPVLYAQERVGAGGRVFRVYKLRSMVTDAEADGVPRWARTRDPRVTRVGQLLRRMRIDEIPQVFNVLRGDMSFVGPRPERPFFVDELARRIPFYEVRHSVKPGITGWAQVRCPYGATLDEARQKLQYDLYYVKNHSLFLDLMILIETVHVVLSGRGAR